MTVHLTRNRCATAPALLNVTQPDGVVGLGDGEGRDGWKGFLVQSPSRLQNQGRVSLQAHPAPELPCMAPVWLPPAQLHTIAQHPSVLLSGSKTQSEDSNLTSAVLIDPLSLWSGGIFFFFFFLSIHKRLITAGI